MKKTIYLLCFCLLFTGLLMGQEKTKHKFKMELTENEHTTKTLINRMSYGYSIVPDSSEVSDDYKAMFLSVDLDEMTPDILNATARSKNNTLTVVIKDYNASGKVVRTIKLEEAQIINITEAWTREGSEEGASLNLTIQSDKVWMNGIKM